MSDELLDPTLTSVRTARYAAEGMLRQRIRVDRATAGVLLVALSVLPLAPVVHELDDAACEIPFVVHDASQHRITAPSPESPEFPTADHCLVCHVLRASRGAAAAASGLASLEASRALAQIESGVRGDASTLPLPARAPPSGL